ncbi:hypothetical protein G7074_14070 [Pedobacter sp. HDW13]|uniref:hypothetical protein n=1 Tax=Pedobacter sp. HDW13 TaxID=2714940 RepID=UPI0014077A5B|nr:hypothetical protein [Pedobacter sp. HDW13]QIL40287.1 hypothetical protein G7074_14070 [Pedobacter sp. HDW13]
MRKMYLAFFASTLFISAFAQKSSDRKGNLAPGGIRIDGHITEWNGLPFTENKRTNLDYVLANDEKNLYLVIKSKEQASISKIMLGGISFIINTDGRKKDKDAYSITYPLVKRAGRGHRALVQTGVVLVAAKIVRNKLLLSEIQLHLLCIKPN